MSIIGNTVLYPVILRLEGTSNTGDAYLDDLTTIQIFCNLAAGVISSLGPPPPTIMQSSTNKYSILKRRIDGPETGDAYLDDLTTLQIFCSLAAGVTSTLGPPPPMYVFGSTLRQRTFQPPESGVLFSTSFFSDASLNVSPNETGLDPSTNAYWYSKVVEVSNNNMFSNPANKGITVVTVQTISNETVGFTKYLGAHTLEFTNWDFSANDPSGVGNDFGVGYDGKNTIKSYNDGVDASANWDLSATMMVGIPTNYAQNSSTNVLFPVAIQSSTEPSYNVINHTDNSNTSFIDLYAVLGRPILVNVKNAYDENLDSILTNVAIQPEIVNVSVISGKFYFSSEYGDVSGNRDNPPTLIYNKPYKFVGDSSIQSGGHYFGIGASNELISSPNGKLVGSNNLIELSGNYIYTGYDSLYDDGDYLTLNWNSNYNPDPNSDYLYWFCLNSLHTANMFGKFQVVRGV